MVNALSPYRSLRFAGSSSVPASSSVSAEALTASSAEQRATKGAPDGTPISAKANGRAAQTGDTEKAEKGTEQSSKTSGGKRELTEEEQKQIEELKRIDAEVRRHEAAHQAAAAGLARGKSFTYEQGPDSKRYAVAGEVQIDTSVVPDDPQATIAKMQRVRAAAMAPAEPSSQDRAVAAQASRAEAEARAQLAEQQSSVGTSASLGGSEAEQSPLLPTEAGTTSNAENRSKAEPQSAAESPSRTATTANPFLSASSSQQRQGVFINAYA